MIPWILVLVLGLIALYIFKSYRAFHQNLAAAKQSGIPYVVVPIYVFNRVWLSTHGLFRPLIDRLPTSWTSSWIQYIHPEWMWGTFNDYFEQIGSGAFLAVSPGGNILYVSDADVVSQISNRRNDFQKPVELYVAINVYGPNVVSSEGSVWRHHRKITAAPFTEKSNALIFQESIRQTVSMLDSWTRTESGETRDESPTIEDVEAATMRFSLHVISRAGFGVQLYWPHEQSSSLQERAIPDGHTMSYKDALEHLLRNVIPIVLLPKWFLLKAPSKKMNKVGEAYVEWGKYMNEIYQKKKAEIANGKLGEGLDLMGAFVNGAGGPSADDPSRRSLLLDEDEVLGNAFVFMLAGHETTANTLHYSLLYLALNPDAQYRLQRDLDDIGLTKTALENWDYDRDIVKLHNSMAGAVINEVLRLIPPVVNIFKRALTAQPLTVEGKRTVVPADTTVSLVSIAAHRNPKFWPSTGQSPKEDLNSFKPERWFNKSVKSANKADEMESYEVIDEPEAAHTVGSLYQPPKGAFIPFSDGPRSCLGKRFAQVELLVALAVLFRTYSVEIAVDEWASDAEIDVLPKGGPQRAEIYQKAKDRTQHMLTHNMHTLFTLMMSGHVPIRVVKRGKERFS